MEQQINAIEISSNIDQQQPQCININDNNSQFSSDFKSDPQQLLQLDELPPNFQPPPPKITNPISPYTTFLKTWKSTHPNQKLNFTIMGTIWKNLSFPEKQIYIKKYQQLKNQYQQYLEKMIIIDPNFINKIQSTKNMIKAIMKQDTNYTTSNDNITAMTKTVEYFAEYLLEEIKKSTEGKKKIDAADLYEIINSNQNTHWFLNCIIDQRNLQNQTPTKIPSHKKTTPVPLQHPLTQQYNKKPEKPLHLAKKPNQQLPKGQLKLTDMF